MKARRTGAVPMAGSEQAWFELYRELREELRGMPGLPADYNPVAEMAKLGMSDKIGPALRFLCHKEVSSYLFPRMQGASSPAELLGQRADGALNGAVRKFLPDVSRET